MSALPAPVPASSPDAVAVAEFQPSSPQRLGELLAGIRTLARTAGAATLEWYRPGDRISAEEKEDRSPVTAADHAADAVIRAGLRALTPGWAIVTEETFKDGALSATEAATRFWLVDPLDGTKEFIQGRDEFTVNIALIERRTPVLGVVYAPALDTLYAAAGPGTAIRCQGDRPDQPIAARRPPPAGLSVVSSLSHDRPEALAAFLARRNATVATLVKCGSSIKFCVIACGDADLYPRLGPTAEWDTAAGHAVVLAAGGQVNTLDGTPLRYGKIDTRLLNPDFIVTGKS